VSIPLGIHCVIPSRLGVGESFPVKIRVLGPVRPIDCRGQFNTRKPGLGSPFNRNVQRQIQFVDNCLPEWQGTLEAGGDAALHGPGSLTFDGVNQGSFPGDRRPIRVFDGFAWTRAGFHFLKLTDPASGLEAWSNPCYVTDKPPATRLYWGDPHWQTFFSDGIRCPEELYHFARHEGFLDFGALADHMEAVTDRQWDYFQAVTNDRNDPGRFVTLHGQEWTHHEPSRGAPGHRNIYYRGAGGPVLRSTDPACDTLAKLWQRLDALGQECLAIPHHPANTVMGVDWEQGWNPTYEKAVEIYSVWGSSEKSAEAGNPRPLAAENLGGEKAGQHVIDALKKGYRFGFVGGGDIHDGRPGNALHSESYPPRNHVIHPQGFTASWAPALTREEIFAALRDRQTYATTESRIYLEVTRDDRGSERGLQVRAASEEGIARAVLVRNGEEPDAFQPTDDPRMLACRVPLGAFTGQDFAYIRVHTGKGNLAWSSPVWGDEGRT